MKNSEPRLFPAFFLSMALTCVQAASAFTYSETDLLLVTRKSGYSDVLFNLGSISNFFSRPIGSTTIISNYPSSLIQSNFGTDLSGVKYILLSSTTAGDSPLRVWLSDAAAASLPLDETVSKWTTQQSKVNAVGFRAMSYPDAGTQAVIISSSDPSSYTYTASGGGTLDVSTMGGSTPFQVEQDIGFAVRLFELKVSSANPKPPAATIGRFTLAVDGTLSFTAGLDVLIAVTNRIYNPFRTDLNSGDYVYVDADPAAGSPVRATQRSLGYREVDYKSIVPGTLSFTAVNPAANGTVVTYDYSSQADKTNTVGFWVNKDVPVMIGPDGNAYITDGHHTTAGYLATISPVRQLVSGKNRVILGHIVANFFNPAAGPVAADDAWWTGRASENNALLYGPDGDQLTLPGEPNYANLQPILPSVLAMPTTPSTITGNGVVAMTPSKYRGFSWGLADAIVVSATDSAGKKIAGYKKSAPGSSVDINFVEFFWADYLRHRIDWDDTLSGSAYGSGNGDASVTRAPLSFFTAVANGTALAKSEVYRDEYGRNISDYTNSSGFPPNTVNWATGSISNGLAAAGNTYHLYLRDDSTMVGDISPSAKSVNILHIDSASTLTVSQLLRNIRTAVINAGGILQTSWKDTTVSNSTLRLPAGTGTVTVSGTGFAAANTIVGGGTLDVEGTVTGNLQLTNGLLQGNGVINGAVSAQGTGIVGPGASIGTLTVNGALSLGGQTVMEFSKSGLTITADLITGVTTLTYGGTLTLTGSGDPLVVGDAIKLFDATSYSGAFGRLNLPALDSGLAWDSSRLVVDGTLTVGLAGSVAPSITAQPTNQTVDASTSLTLTLGAVGTEPISYQWRFNGGDLSDQTSATLKFASVAEANQGLYDFVATNSGGSVTSNPAILTVNQRPAAQGQSLVMSWNNSAPVTLTGSDPDGDTLAFSIVAQPAHGTLTGTAPNVVYQPASGYVGPDSFTFKVNDGRLDSANATVSITVRQDFTYQDTDLLLVFHKAGFNDVLFNLGNVSNYFGLSYGATLSVSNWDFGRVTASFGADLTDVKYILMAATAASDARLRVWLSDSASSGVPHDETVSKWSTQRGKIAAVGTLASAYAYPDATNQSVTLSPSNLNSYTYIASGGGTVDVSTMGGSAPFQVEQDLGSSMRLFELKVSSANPKPFAGEIGRFTLSTDGNLSFTAEFNRAPAAGSDSFATRASDFLWIPAAQLLFNDSDPDGDALSIVPSVFVSHGFSGSFGPEGLHYGSASLFRGVDTISYTISDGHGGTATGQVQILVTDEPIPSYNHLAVTSSPIGFGIRFSGTAGRSYEIQRAADVAGPWTTIATLVAPTYGIIDYVDPSQLADQAFYRAYAP